MLLVSDSAVRVRRMSMGEPSEPAGEDHRRSATPSPAPDQGVSRLWPWGIATVLALAVVWLASGNFALSTETLRTERRLAEVSARTAQNLLAERTLLAERMINDAGARLRRAGNLTRLQVIFLSAPSDTTRATRATIVWDPDQQTGLLASENLPALAAGQDYQIWIVDPAYPHPVSGSAFHVAAEGRVTLAFKPEQPVGQAAAFAISLETKGGATKAEGPILLRGQLPGT